jgi:hypothetical protein
MRFGQLQQLSYIALFLALIGCGAGPQEEARIKLGQMNVKYDEDSFVDASTNGDTQVPGFSSSPA